ncbi:MAG TPA: HD domain-containing protein, partial [Anaerolineales bacterium]
MHPPLPSLLDRVRQALPPGLPVYLVGGAVRDALLNRPVHDLDFVLGGNVLKVGRRVANKLEAAYYPLDTERDTARVILEQPDGSREVLDFAALRGPDLESDLRQRDFTVNALAISVHEPEILIDPLGGAADLRAGLLRACSPAAFENDPVRILRAVRLAYAFNLRILPETRSLMSQAVGLLPRVSPERLRDELFRILDGPQPAAGLRLLDRLGVLPYVLPELPALQGVSQSPPHTQDVWDHTLAVVQRLQALLGVLAPEPDPDLSANLALGLVSMRLGRYREQIQAHLNTPLNADRSLRPLLVLTALYHDIAKPQTRQVEEGGRIRFLEHDKLGALTGAARAQALRLSNDEVERLELIISNHMRPHLLSQNETTPSRRAIYRFFRDTGPAGVDVCLLALADTLAMYGPTLPPQAWGQEVDVVRSLLEAWWEQPHEIVSPPALVNGNELIKAFHLKPGPQIGQLLEAIREAQANGDVHSREQALEL